MLQNAKGEEEEEEERRKWDRAQPERFFGAIIGWIRKENEEEDEEEEEEETRKKKIRSRAARTIFWGHNRLNKGEEEVEENEEKKGNKEKNRLWCMEENGTMLPRRARNPGSYGRKKTVPC